jgi:hypothetical protein
VTLDGKQLPAPPLPFRIRGVIKGSAVDSKPYWPPRIVPPKGAPNILLIMTDDQGYRVSSTFGGVIPAPTLDRIPLGTALRNSDGSCGSYHIASRQALSNGTSCCLIFVLSLP